LAHRATCPAPLTGFEPATSTVTGWRAIRSLSKGVSFRSKRPAGVEPAHPPWQSGRPAVTSRARCIVTDRLAGFAPARPLHEMGHALLHHRRIHSVRSLRQELNLFGRLTKPAGYRYNTEAIHSVPARNRTWSTTFGELCATGTPRGQFREHPAGVEPATPAWEAGALPLRHRYLQWDREDSNLHLVG
jgi:hypothetical protein